MITSLPVGQQVSRSRKFNFCEFNNFHNFCCFAASGFADDRKQIRFFIITNFFYRSRVNGFDRSTLNSSLACLIAPREFPSHDFSRATVKHFSVYNENIHQTNFSKPCFFSWCSSCVQQQCRGESDRATRERKAVEKANIRNINPFGAHSDFSTERDVEC